MLIGYMHYRKQPFELNRAYAFAAVAKAEGAEMLYFSPGAVRADGIGGYVYHGGEWARADSRYPDAVYNAAGFSERRREGFERLRAAGVPFTSHSVGDKMTVYNNLKRYGKFAGYLIPSETVQSGPHFQALLEQYSDIVVKPSWGRQGADIYRVAKGCAVPEAVWRLLAEEECFVQPYVNCRTKAGEPYDFRLHAQKGGGGEWTVPCVYPRISSGGGIVCNISRGGYTRDLTEFLKEQFGGEHYSVRKYLEVFALQLARHMDEIQQDLYGEELDELGIDAGLENGRLYLYEVNWRPGFPPYNGVDLTVIRNSVRFAMRLAERKKSAI
ncbi:MAG: YheC/YheD family protein [Oscillospiraceae bacterium]|nr:YheC/YheD family protein [Oscillospiraceae bacterium]